MIVADDGGFEMQVYGNPVCRTPHWIIWRSGAPSSPRLHGRQQLLALPLRHPDGAPTHQNGMYGLHQGYHHFNSFDGVRSLPGILAEHDVRTGIVGRSTWGPRPCIRSTSRTRRRPSPSCRWAATSPTSGCSSGSSSRPTTRALSPLRGLPRPPPLRPHPTAVRASFCEKFGNGDPGMGYIPDWRPAVYDPAEVEVPSSSRTRRRRERTWRRSTRRLPAGPRRRTHPAGASERSHAQDTLVIYTSDNGIPFPAGRTNLYDPGMAEPLLVSSPLHRLLGEHHSRPGVSPRPDPDFVASISFPRESRKRGESQRDPPGAADDEGGEPSVRQDVRQTRYEPTVTAEELSDAVFASHDLHEVTMYYPMRAIRTHTFKLIHNLNYKMPFHRPGFYLAPVFQDIFNRTQRGRRSPGTRRSGLLLPRRMGALRPPSRSPRAVQRGEEGRYQGVFRLTGEVVAWQNATYDPWVCGPGAVLSETAEPTPTTTSVCTL
ncbi:putative N-sulfoglucosamine sulfohydrolase isoform X1 [Penaeus vannamei]|uniref:Putative N-sulfoglucosamine sulfohydrolase isoform X1 n=1 Tax=Penaeus vannamei TaxID=6689 RepID=A0A3R7MBA8_PENVA|nr:putative N-sulfoglucosamine sulfohydrolase isoform X1 [Penaeus vannamei]